MKTQQEILSSLQQFSGSEQYHRWSPLFPKVVATDGVMFLARECCSFWLLDVVGSVLPEFNSEEFLTATYNKEQHLFTLDDGNGNVLYAQQISLPTFPLDEIKLFVTDGEGYKVIMLPSEY